MRDGRTSSRPGGTPDGGAAPPAAVPGVSEAPLEHRDHGAAKVLAYRVLERNAVEQDRTDVTELLHAARGRHWYDIEVVLLLARFSVAAPVDGGRAEAAQILEAAERSQDDALVGTALAIQAIAGAPHRQAPFPVQRARDLPQAVALLDRAVGSAVDRATGYLSCALGYHAQGLWELALDLYQRAEMVLAAPCPDGLRPICEVQRAAIAVHRHQSMLALGCALIEVGRREAAQRLAADRAPLRQPEQIPEGYRTMTTAAELILAVMAGGADSPAVDALSTGPTAQDAADPVIETSRLLAAALRAHDRDDRPRSTRLAAAALAGLDGRLGFAVYGLGLLLAVGGPDHDEDHDEETSADLRRFAAYQAGLRWRSRQGLVEAARALIEAEGLLLSSEREPLP